MTFTYSEAITPASILAGWNGSLDRDPRARQQQRRHGRDGVLRRREHDALGLLTAGTVLTINADYVTAATLFNATIVRSGSTITITIGTLISGAVTDEAQGQDAR